MKTVFIIYCIFHATAIVSATKQHIPSVTTLNIGSIIKYTSEQLPGFFSTDLRIYCYPGSPKYLSHIFQSINLELDIDTDDFVQYDGGSPEIVQTHYDKQRSIFSLNLFGSNKQKLIKINPFNQTCVGIETPHPYIIRMKMIRIDFWKVLLCSIGIFMFLMAKGLSETPLFYYITGILLGITASVSIVVYFLSKFFPRKPMMYGAMVGGWALSLYFVQMLWENIQVILITYQVYVFWYIIITGFISFIVCYRFGPPTNERSKNIIKWGLQFAAIILIYVSSHFREATVGICILLNIFYYFPTKLWASIRSWWLRKFPPKPKLLTNDEYNEQTIRETTKALENLKNFCNSPEAKPWSVMMKLKDPQRFASFIEGSPHLLESERTEYETSCINNSDISDDSDDNDDGDENDNGNEELVLVPATIIKSTQRRQTPTAPIIKSAQRRQTPTAPASSSSSSSNTRSVDVATINKPRYRGRSLTKSMQASTQIKTLRPKNGNLQNGQRYDPQIELSEEDD